MNKGGGGGGGGVGAQGPTAGATAAAATRQRSLLQRTDADIASLLDNFSHLLKAARINDPVRNSQEVFQMKVHAERVVQAADSLLKLVSELKQTAVFADFASLNEHVEQRVTKFEEQCDESKQVVTMIGEDAATSLRELESHYYTSLHDNPDLYYN